MIELALTYTFYKETIYVKNTNNVRAKEIAELAQFNYVKHGWKLSSLEIICIFPKYL